MIPQLFVLLSCLICMTFTDAVKLLPLRPLKTIGSYTSYVSQAGTAELVANTKRCFFLSKPNLEVVDNTYSNNDGMGDEETVRDVTLIDILPIPLADTREERLVYTSLKPETNSGTNVFDDSVLALILNRDKGAFDNLPFSWAPSPQSAKKEIYDSFQHSIGTSNSVKRVGRMGSFIETVQNKLSCVITGLIIEVNDEFSDASVSLSGGVILAKKTCENINEWKLSNQNAFLPEKLSTDDNVKYVDVCLMYCRLHELICISLETKLPIYIPESLFDSISVDGMLSNMGGTDNDTNNKMTITAEAPRQVLKMMKNNNIKNTVNSSKGTADLVWEIYDARKFLKMTAVQKRALLRASNVNKLPRPSLGDSALDNVLVSHMDEAVGDEYLRLKASGPGSNSRANEQTLATSPRQLLLQRMALALEEGDEDEAVRLREEFAILTSQRADPTQKVGSYDPYLDQDDWYMRERRKAMR